MPILFALLGSVSAITVEAMWRAGNTPFTHWWMVIPMITIQVGIWGLYTHSEKFFGAVILFSSVNMILRVLVGTKILDEKLTWGVALGFVFMLLANYFIKR